MKNGWNIRRNTRKTKKINTENKIITVLQRENMVEEKTMTETRTKEEAVTTIKTKEHKVRPKHEIRQKCNARIVKISVIKSSCARTPDGKEIIKLI